MSIKPTYIITGMDFQNIAYDDGEAFELKSETAAVKAAKETIATLADYDQVWIWRLSHVVSKESNVEVKEVT
jgi:hypothetical protein